MWKLSADGFVMQYMVTRPVIEDYASELKGKNQLELEGLLRREIVKEKKEYLSEMSDRCFRDYEGEAWQVYAPFGANMIDLSDFYSTLKRIEINAAAVVMSPKEMPAHVRIWSYMAAGVYLNGKLAGEIALPRYKPINYTDIFLTLREGENHFVFVCENLGVRDSRNILGMQFLGGGVSDLEVTLPKASLGSPCFRQSFFWIL